MSFSFKVFVPDISNKARELAEKFGYHPYMIERYYSMFGVEETLEFLAINESLSPLAIRINSLKTNPQTVSNSLRMKGYQLTPSEQIPYAYIIEQDAKSEEILQKSSTSPEYQQHGFERDHDTLKELEWGRPSYLEENYLIDAEKRQDIKSSQHLRERQIATLGSTNEYLMGCYYIQDLASMFPSYYLSPQPDDFIVDMCAAPGGKTTHLAQIMENQGHIFALDNNKKRIKSLIYNVRRCGIMNTTVLLLDASSTHKQGFHPNKILLDAPCTGEGLIRDDPSRKTNKNPTDITGMMRKQYSLLYSAVKSIKPGGQIMYSTCSIAPEENEFVIQKVLDTNPDIEIVSVNDEWGLPGYINVFGMDLSEDLLKARRLFPHIHNTIGFFYCLLQKRK